MIMSTCTAFPHAPTQHPMLTSLSLQFPDGKDIQINLTGFLNAKNARLFVEELWILLLSAMDSPEGVPVIFDKKDPPTIVKVACGGVVLDGDAGVEREGRICTLI